MALAALFISAGAVTSMAQAGCDDLDAINELDAKIRENYGKNATVGAAIEAGKQYLEKFGHCEATADFSKWVKDQMPAWEKRKKDYDEYEYLAPRFKRFDGGIGTNNTTPRAQNADEVFAAGRELLAKQPENLNFMVPMAMAGIIEAFNNNTKHADEALRLAQASVAKLKAGAESTRKDKDGKITGTYGVLKYEFQKQEAIDELTFGMAYILFTVKKDKKAALPLYYELSQSSEKYKKVPSVYGAIGDFYLEQSVPISNEIAALIEKQKTLPTDEEKIKMDAEIEAKIALFKGYAERAMDAFARAHKVAPNNTPAEKAYRDNLYKTLSELYKRRFEKDTGLDQYIAETVTKPFPNPTTEVKPIVDPKPDATTTTTSTAAGTATNGKTASTKP